MWDGKSADNGDEEETGSEHRGLRERLGLKFLKSHSERDEAQDAGHGEGEPRSVALQRGEPRVLHGEDCFDTVYHYFCADCPQATHLQLRYPFEQCAESSVNRLLSIGNTT